MVGSNCFHRKGRKPFSVFWGGIGVLFFAFCIFYEQRMPLKVYLFFLLFFAAVVIAAMIADSLAISREKAETQKEVSKRTNG